MASLEKIARALGSSQLELIAAAADELEHPDQSETVLVRSGDGTRGHYAQGEARLLVHGTRAFNPMEFRGENLESGEFFAHDEAEFVHVISGTVEIDLGEHGVSILQEGDSLYYGGGTPHRWRGLEPGGYRLFVVKEKPQQL
jgi:quercetin dioxygenase-like cupin family protein